MQLSLQRHLTTTCPNIDCYEMNHFPPYLYIEDIIAYRITPIVYVFKYCTATIYQN